MAEFTWFPDASISKDVEPRVASARFGDGYEQRVPLGINTQIDKWQLTFTGNRERIDPIEAFIAAQGGYLAFDWKNPDEQTGRYVCRSWKKQRQDSQKVILTCEFERVFGS